MIICRQTTLSSTRFTFIRVYNYYTALSCSLRDDLEGDYSLLAENKSSIKPRRTNYEIKTGFAVKYIIVFISNLENYFGE